MSPLLFLFFSSPAEAADAWVVVQDATVALSRDAAHIVVVGEVFVSEGCTSLCAVVVVHDDDGQAVNGFDGKGIVTDDGVLLRTDGLRGLHIGQAGIVLDEDPKEVLVSFKEALDDEVDVALWLDWGRSGAAAAWTAALETEDGAWVVGASALVGLAPESMTVTTPDVAALGLGDLPDGALKYPDPLDLVFESPLEPAYLEKALEALAD